MVEGDWPKTRRDARSAGRTHYYTGTPCKNGHDCLRSACGNCVECAAESLKRWERPAELKAKDIERLRAHYAQPKFNKEWHRAYQNEWARKRRRSDPQTKVKNLLRSRLRYALNGLRKEASSLALMGCTPKEACDHIERCWQPGMTWSNHGRGRGTWQIDHIKPFSFFDLSDPAQIAAACHFSNLQPLWFDEHARKTTQQRIVRKNERSNQEVAPRSP